MNKEEIAKRYTEMASTIEDAKIYDGRGTYDQYSCNDCGRMIFTTYEMKGVTPFIIFCKCGKHMQHDQSYKSMPDHIRVYKWKRPTLEETLKLPDHSINHILNGGLILDIDLYASLYQTSDPIKVVEDQSRLPK